MQNLEEGGDSIASHLSNLGLLNEGLVEERRRILLLLASTTIAVAVFPAVLDGRHARDVEAHLHELIPSSTCLLALPPCAAQVAVGAGVAAVLRQRHLYSNLVPTRQVRVPNLRVRQLKGGLVLHAEGELVLLEVGLSPVPAPQGVLLALESDAVPVLEEAADAVVVVLGEAVELVNDGGLAAEDLDLIALCGAAPLCGGDG